MYNDADHRCFMLIPDAMITRREQAITKKGEKRQVSSTIIRVSSQGPRNSQRRLFCCSFLFDGDKTPDGGQIPLPAGGLL